ncbi:MAG TPA: hypothetical protein VFT31_12570 [Kribbella sp.]|nr:hypothetical protein [Kribbella sp.]
MSSFGMGPEGPGLGTQVHLHARIFRRTEGPPGSPWYVDIDDLADPQPDDPYWYGYYGSQRAAVDAACQRMAALRRDRPARISQQALPRATSAA